MSPLADAGRPIVHCMQSEAARIAAELLAEEEAEKQKAEAAQQRKKEKKAARKAAKKASGGGPSAEISAPQAQQAAQEQQQAQQAQQWEGDTAQPSLGRAGSGSLSGFSLLQQGARDDSGAPNGLAVLLAAPPQSPTITGRVGLLDFGQQQAAPPPDQASGSGLQGGAESASGSGGGKKSKKKGKGKGRGAVAQQQQEQQQQQGSGRRADPGQPAGSSAAAELPDPRSHQQHQPLQQPAEQQQQGGSGSSDSGLQLPARGWFTADELPRALVPAGPPAPNQPEAPGASWLHSAEVPPMQEPAVAEQEAEFRVRLHCALPLGTAAGGRAG